MTDEYIIQLFFADSVSGTGMIFTVFRTKEVRILLAIGASCFSNHAAAAVSAYDFSGQRIDCISASRSSCVIFQKLLNQIKLYRRNNRFMRIFRS